MQKAKSSSRTRPADLRPTLATTFKSEKVDKLNQIVHELEQVKKETVTVESEPQGREVRNGMSEKVLQVLKRRIKTNYDQLYSNYPENKNKILKQIQTVQSNISGENVMTHKQEEVIKQKTKYDKLKAALQQKQRKLKKLLDLRSQLKRDSQPDPADLSQQSTIEEHQLRKQQSEQSNLILNDMLKQRKSVLLALKKKQITFNQQLSDKLQKHKKLKSNNLKRKQAIHRLEESLSQEAAVQIPGKLAEELSSKLQQYENKHSYNNIIHHEAILEEQRFQQLRKETALRKEEQRQHKLKKEKQQKQQLQQLHQIYALNNAEEHSLKRLCGVESVQEILKSDLNVENGSLAQLEAQIQEEIKQYQEANKHIQQEIKDIMSKDKEDPMIALSVQELIANLQQEETLRKLLQNELNKKKSVLTDWRTLMHLINGNRLNKEAVDELIDQVLKKSAKPIQKTDHKENSPRNQCTEEGESIDFQ